MVDKAVNGTGANAGAHGALALRNVWKLYGPGAEQALRPGSAQPAAADLAAKGIITAVRDVSLDVHAGEIFIIMGLSGSGKSTLVRCMTRLIEPTAGQVLFHGQDLLHISERELIEIRRHKMGMVFQHFALLPHLTVLDNVAFPLEIQGMARAKRYEHARRVIELVGLAGRESYFPRELSGGQQQRVGIARSLAVEPEVWFLDEPFSALDPLIRREMQDEFLRLQNMLKKTIVFITHDFDEAIRLADRIAIMKDGVIIQIGTPEDLVTRPADGYVAEFTRDVPRAKVLSVRSIMEPVDGPLIAENQVAAAAKVQDIADEVMRRGTAVAVVDAAGATIGLLTKDAVLAALLGRETRR
ncbi:MAG: betaine/proline/choline family ABC transporter ATP-binding protein [Alphaproteobacteria bacterium]|nr:betaine/proline/choline family ABC transporter ATP-binding protein [Alphaproteobacteria bacterium]